MDEQVYTTRLTYSDDRMTELEQKRQNWDGRQWLLLLAILVVGVVLRAYPIHENVWIDELHTAWAVAADGDEFSERVRLGNSSPLYFLLVKAVTIFLGLKAWTLRLISISCGIALIPMTFFLARFWKCSLESSLLATALVAIDRNAVFYSVEARPYACVQLMSMCHLFLFSRLLLRRNDVWMWMAWILLGILMFHLHFTAALIFAAEVVAFAILHFTKSNIKLHWIYFAIGVAVLMAGMLPSTGSLQEIAARRENWNSFIPRTRNPLAILTIFPCSVYLFAPLAMGVGSWALKRLKIQSTTEEDTEASEVPSTSNHEFRALLIVALCWLFIPMLIAWVLTERDVARLFFLRYLIASSVALAPITALIVSMSLTGRRTRFYSPWILLLIGVLIASPLHRLRSGTDVLAHSLEDWKSPVRIINSVPDIPVVLYSGLIESSDWYDSPELSQHSYCELPIRGGLYSISENQPIISLPARVPLELSEAAVNQLQEAGQDGLWLLVRGRDDLASDVQNEVLKILGRNVRVTKIEDFGRVHLRRIGR